MGISSRATQNLGGAIPPHVSIRNQRFSLVKEDGTKVDLPPTPSGFVLDVIIADANPDITRVCYLKDFDPKATDHSPPDCYSNDGRNPDSSLGGAAGPYDMNWKHIEGGCAMCWANKWGSEVSKFSGKGVKKCKEGKSLAVVAAGELCHGEAFLLRITPGTRKLFQSYCAELSRKKVGGMEVDISHVVTRLSFDAQVQGVLNFRPVGWVHESDIDLSGMYESHAFMALLGGVETPPELLAPPLTPQLVHQSQTAAPPPAREPPPPPKQATPKYDLPFDDDIPFQ